MAAPRTLITGPKKRPVSGAAVAVLPQFNPRLETVDDLEQRIQQHLTQHPAKGGMGNAAVADKRHRALLLQLLAPAVRKSLQATLKPRDLALVAVPTLLGALRIVRLQILADATKAAKAALQPGGAALGAALGAAPKPPKTFMPNAKPRIQLQKLQQAESCSVADYALQLDQLVARCGYDEDIAEAVAKDRLIIGLASDPMRRRLVLMLDRPGGASYAELRDFALRMEETGNPEEPIPLAIGRQNQVWGPSGPRGNGNHMGETMRNCNFNPMPNSMGSGNFNSMGNGNFNQVARPMENQMGDYVCENGRNPMGNYVSENMRNPMSDYVSENVRNPVEDYVSENMRNNMGDYESENLRNHMGDYESENLRNHMGDYESENLRNHMGDYESENLRNHMGDYESENLRNHVGDYVSENMGNPMGDYVRENRRNPDFVEGNVRNPEREYGTENMRHPMEQPMRNPMGDHRMAQPMGDQWGRVGTMQQSMGQPMGQPTPREWEGNGAPMRAGPPGDHAWRHQDVECRDGGDGFSRFDDGGQGVGWDGPDWGGFDGERGAGGAGHRDNGHGSDWCARCGLKVPPWRLSATLAAGKCPECCAPWPRGPPNMRAWQG